MSSQSIVCASCSAAVPYGRLSCPSCGELLASVAGSARRVPVERPAKRVARPRTEPATAAARATRSPSSVLIDVEPEVELEPELLAVAEPRPAEDSGWDTPVPATRLDDEPQWPVDQRDEASVSLPYVLRPVAPSAAPVPSAPVAPAPAPAGAPMLPVAAFAAPALATAPGAYVPPMLPVDPAGPPAPARAWAGHAAEDPAQADGARSMASAAALVDAARIPEFVGWLAVAGSAMAAVGFVLPWGVAIIGASGIDYFDRWGMAGPFHPIMVLALLGVLALALIRNVIPLWLRVGLPGLGMGALLLGLGWPYLFALPGRGPGVLVVAIGAILLIVAGIIALAPDRHADEDRAI